MSQLIPYCKCNKECQKKQVKKDGLNKGKYFWTCANRRCKTFHWDPVEYDPSRFKEDACGRCGRYNCNEDECEEIRDWFGIPIPH